MQIPVVLPTPTAGREPVVFIHKLRLRDRAAARLFSFRLDRELADGVAPDRSAAHLLRAERLVGPSARAALARALRSVVRDARTGRRRLTAAQPRRRHVLRAAPEIEALARRLVAPAPVSVRGVARAELLLGDGCGPLYAGDATTDLRATVRRAVADLELATV